jgi:hypothetical protein
MFGTILVSKVCINILNFLLFTTFWYWGIIEYIHICFIYTYMLHCLVEFCCLFDFEFVICWTAFWLGSLSGSTIGEPHDYGRHVELDSGVHMWRGVSRDVWTATAELFCGWNLEWNSAVLWRSNTYTLHVAPHDDDNPQHYLFISYQY